MNRLTHILIIGLFPLYLAGCQQKPAELPVQEQITLDYHAIHLQLDSIHSILYADTLLDPASEEYAQLSRMDDSLQTALFDLYPAEELRQWAAEHKGKELPAEKYESFIVEVGACKEISLSSPTNNTTKQ